MQLTKTKVGGDSHIPTILAQDGFTLVELLIALTMSSIVLVSIFIIVSGSHTYILNGRDKIRLQQDFSLIGSILARKIRTAKSWEQKIYNSYSDYVASQPAQSTGSCIKLYYPSGDSGLLYQEDSDFKIQNADLSVTQLVQSVVDTVAFTDQSTSVKTVLSLVNGDWSIADTLVNTFRNVGNGDILDADFDTDEDGFSYLDDTFRSTSEPNYETGTRLASGGYSGGGLQVVVGGIDDSDILGMSGGWRRSFTLNSQTSLTVSLRYNLTLPSEYESDEYGEALVSIDGTLYGESPNDYMAHIADGGTSGWQLFQFNVTLSSGNHTITIGAYNNKKTYNDESTEVLIDDVKITTNN